METIKPTINAQGYRTAVKDYDEKSVIEELAANSYDADASTVLVILEGKANCLYIIDDGKGFKEDSLKEATTLGGGDKTTQPFSQGERPYLGRYGFGLKSTLNIANKISIKTVSEDGLFKTEIDWMLLDEIIKSPTQGYIYTKDVKSQDSSTGSIIKLFLKGPTTKTHLDAFGEVLSNLPNDNGGFKCYYGYYEDTSNEIKNFIENFRSVKETAASLFKDNKLGLASESFERELHDCEVHEIKDKEDRTVSAKIYFAGMQGDKVKSLKEVLRGVYVRVHGRLLKHNFSEDKYVYIISKYPMFKHGLRVELTVNWLRNQISLSRDGIKFGEEKLERDFKAIVGRLISKFIAPKLETIHKKRAKASDVKLKQRMELAEKRAHNNQGALIKGLNGGFIFKPETDAEVAILLSQSEVMSKIDKNYKLIDYNDKAPFDCIIYNSARRDFIYTELEPTLVEFLEHKTKDDIEFIIAWSLGKWRMGAKHKGKKGFFELIQNSNGRKGNYKLLEYPNKTSKKAREEYQVVVLDEILVS